MPIPEDYIDQCLYAPSSWFLHDVDFFPEEKRLVGHCDTTQLGPLVDAQVVRPGHPKHFPGAVAVQLTGTLGQLYAVYMLGLKATDGWSGFGTHIHKARFSKLGTIGPEVLCHTELLSHRVFRGTHFTKFSFRYEQEGEAIYESMQSAAWVQQ